MSVYPRILTQLASDVRRAVATTLDDPEMLETFAQKGYSREALEPGVAGEDLST